MFHRESSHANLNFKIANKSMQCKKAVDYWIKSPNPDPPGLRRERLRDRQIESCDRIPPSS